MSNPELTIEVTGDEGKVEKLLDLLKTFGVIDLTRTGKVADAEEVGGMDCGLTGHGAWLGFRTNSIRT